MTSTRPAQAGFRAIPAAAGGAVIREVRAVQGTGPLSGPSASLLTGSLPLDISQPHTIQLELHNEQGSRPLLLLVWPYRTDGPSNGRGRAKRGCAGDLEWPIGFGT